MKALRTHEFGLPATTVLEDIEPTPPGQGQVSVRIEAASVNPLDVQILAGRKQAVFPIQFPYTLGTDFAGVIDAVGLDVDGFRRGDRVAGRLDPRTGGAFAEYVNVAEASLCLLPAGIPSEQFAAVPTAAGTARQALFDAGGLVAGQRVLIHAGAGGVGHFAVQLAKQAGAHVIATASAKNLAWVRNLGADEVIDHQAGDFPQRLGGVDLVLDTRGGETLERSWAVVRPGGIVVSIVVHTIQPRGDIRGVFTSIKHLPSALDGVVRGVAAGRLQVMLDSTYPLADAGAALQRVADGHARGKVVIRVAP